MEYRDTMSLAMGLWPLVCTWVSLYLLWSALKVCEFQTKCRVRSVAPGIVSRGAVSELADLIGNVSTIFSPAISHSWPAPCSTLRHMAHLSRPGRDADCNLAQHPRKIRQNHSYCSERAVFLRSCNDQADLLAGNAVHEVSVLQRPE